MVTEPDTGLEVEEILTKRARLAPRSALKKAFKTGQIKRNGRATKRSDLVRAGDEITVESGEASLYVVGEARVLANANLPLEVVAQSSKLVVVNKAAGRSAHPLRPDESATELNAIVARFSDAGRAFHPDKPLEGGLVHRLDRGTSGLLVSARDFETFAKLKKTWTSRSLEKIYVAWVSGLFEKTGELEVYLAHDPKSRKRMMAMPERTKTSDIPSWRARTSVLPLKTVLLETHEPATLVLIRIHTGVMHQIRATFAALGCPVLGDAIYPLSKYGKKARTDFQWTPLDDETSREFQNLCTELVKCEAPRPELLPEDGFFLHAYFLRAREFEELARGVIAPLPRHWGSL